MSTATIGGDAIRQILSGHQSRFFLAIVCAASVMCATSAQAHDNHNNNNNPDVTRTVVDEEDFPFSDYNPCIDSVVSGQGHFHSVYIERQKGTTFESTFRIHEKGTASNTVPGDMGQYKYKHAAENNFRSSTRNWTFTMKMRKQILRQGPPPPPRTKDDYFAWSKVKFSANSPKPFRNSDESESVCR